MWGLWWVWLGAGCLLVGLVLGLLYLLIEFPGLSSWKVVHKESQEGRARQEQWRRDSLVLHSLGERRERRRESRVARARMLSVDQGVQCEEDESPRLQHDLLSRVIYERESKEEGRERKVGREERRLGREERRVTHTPFSLHSPVSTDDEGDSGVFPHSKELPRVSRVTSKEGGVRLALPDTPVVILITPQNRHKDFTVLDTLDLALDGQISYKETRDLVHSYRHS